MTIRFRPAAASDAPYLLWLEEICMRTYAEALWGAWRPSATAETLDVAGHDILLVGDESCGCIAVTWHPDHMFVDKLYIPPAHQGQGIGAVALREKTKLAAERGLPTRLSVLTTNPADRFYRREGFVLETETSERRRFIKPVS